jgi:polar amino acid transport system ATP-binding protein
MSAIVEIENISKCFGATRVLEDVSFTVKKGSVVAIIGQSGSGKSTALRCIDRLETVDQGRIRVCGHEVTAPGLDLHQLRRDVGIVFQSYNLFPHLTVEENIMLAPRLVQKTSRAAARQRALQVLEQVGLGEKATCYPSQLSGGQQQRVAIARSLAMSPQLMLFDEVTSALDPQLTGEVLRVMERLARWPTRSSSCTRAASGSTAPPPSWMRPPPPSCATSLATACSHLFLPTNHNHWRQAP